MKTNNMNTTSRTWETVSTLEIKKENISNFIQHETQLGKNLVDRVKSHGIRFSQIRKLKLALQYTYDENKNLICRSFNYYFTLNKVQPQMIRISETYKR